MKKNDVVMGGHNAYFKIGILNCKVGGSLCKTMKESKRPYEDTGNHHWKNGSLPHLYVRHFRLRPRQDGGWISISDRQALELIVCLYRGVAPA